MLLSNILVALSVYWIEHDNIKQAEIARLSHQMGRLKQLFDRDLEFTRNLLFLVERGDAIRSFVRETDEDFRTTALGAKIQDGIEFFSKNSNLFVSFAILRPDLTVDYYFEKSDDPFASLNAAQIAAAERLRTGSDLIADEFLVGEVPLLIHSELVAPTTLSRPLATQRDSALIIQSAVRPRDFVKMKTELETEYGTPVIIASDIVFERSVFTAIDTLLPDLKVGLALTDTYMARRLQSLKIALATRCLVLTLISVGLLLYLIRRTVTGPISTLDRQVTDVLSGHRQNLDRMNGGSEIEHLAGNIKMLHDRVLATLDEVQTASWTDALTGISNRLHFSLLGERALESAVETKTGLSLLFIDLDNFKFVNDTFGHAVGDAVLKRFTTICEATLDQTAHAYMERPPLFARLSGDEFAILLREPGDEAAALNVALRIVENVEAGMIAGGEIYPVTASIGIACFPDDARTFTQLVACADKAMYHAKIRGKNDVARYMAEFADDDVRIEQIKFELQRLNPDDEFSLVYMPIVSRHGVVEKCEALLRWKSPVLGAVSPGEFIPVAESNALFSKIDRWVLHKAVGDLAALQQIFGDQMMLGINISTAELTSSAIVRDCVEALLHHGASPSTVEIELTETFAARIPAKAKLVVEALKEAGFQISLDDFGSGYTSLKQILEFPLDTVKLDRELVMQLLEPRGLQTLTAIIDMCHAQNCLVVAEGVEDSATQAALALAGCDLFQGFGIHRPASLAELRLKWRRSELSREMCDGRVANFLG
jgi:diguanylate cyclase (GGDEF)-like protein